MISGKPHVPGDRVALPDLEALYLVNIGKGHWPPEEPKVKKGAVLPKETATEPPAEKR